MSHYSQFKKQVQLNAPATLVFDWHEQPMTLERLTPPWERVTLLSHTGDGIKDGAKVKICQYMGPIPSVWEMEHWDYQYGVQFRDRMLKGPFAYWDHLHHFESISETMCSLTDDIHYRLHFYLLTEWAGNAFVHHKLETLFTYRHQITKLDIDRLNVFLQLKLPPLVLGIIGHSQTHKKILIPFLSTQGHTIITVDDKLKPTEKSLETINAIIDVGPVCTESEKNSLQPAKHIGIPVLQFKPKVKNILENWQRFEDELSIFYYDLLEQLGRV